MTTSGSAIFFDGKTSARHDVTVELAPEALRVRAPDGAVLAAWPYDELETLSAPDDVLRLGQFGNPVLARLEVRDPTLAAAIDDLSVPVDRSGRSERRMRRKIVLWTRGGGRRRSCSSRSSGLPAIADPTGAAVPYPVERRLGRAGRRAGARARSTPASSEPPSNAAAVPARKRAGRRSTS